MPAKTPHAFRDELPLVFWFPTKGKLLQVRGAFKRKPKTPEPKRYAVHHRQRRRPVGFGVDEQHGELGQDAPCCLKVPGAQETQPIGFDGVEPAIFPVARDARKQEGTEPSEPHYGQQRHRELPRRARVAQRSFPQQASRDEREMRQTATQIVELFAAAW